MIEADRKIRLPDLETASWAALLLGQPELEHALLVARLRARVVDIRCERKGALERPVIPLAAQRSSLVLGVLLIADLDAYRDDVPVDV